MLKQEYWSIYNVVIQKKKIKITFIFSLNFKSNVSFASILHYLFEHISNRMSNDSIIKRLLKSKLCYIKISRIKIQDPKKNVQNVYKSSLNLSKILICVCWQFNLQSTIFHQILSLPFKYTFTLQSIVKYSMYSMNRACVKNFIKLNIFLQSYTTIKLKNHQTI